MIRKTASIILLVLFDLAAATAQYGLIPRPASLRYFSGNFIISPTTVLVCSDKNSTDDIKIFNQYLKDTYGIELKIGQPGKAQTGNINISVNPDLEEDAYNLVIDTNMVSIEGGKGSGIFYAMETMIQLLPPGKGTSLTLPCLIINDKPRLKYRGMHLDVARHFFPVEVVKNYIDHIAMYKMNYFHWHLTDDQGWRIEIKKYPKLQQISAWRKGTLIGHYFDKPALYDTISYGGYYTQEQIKEVVHYAASRHVIVIPEIEMPGHATAALAAYPMCSCTGGPFEVGKTWGVYNDVFCPKDLTFNFLQDILDEVCNLFPGKYIHIGGDECPKDRWKNCASCQKLIRDEKLVDENGLQRYFTNKISEYLKTKNKIAIGWDEILDDHLDRDAVIMSYRGVKGAIEGATKGHDVIMNPYDFCYFDAYDSRDTAGQLAIGGYLPLDKVLSFEPVPVSLSTANPQHILGAQGNVWTEYITNENRLNEMTFPRICALSEVLWSPPEFRNYYDFTTRLTLHLKFLNFNKVNYSVSLYDVRSRSSCNESKQIGVELYSSFPRGTIHYTLDGTDPGWNSDTYSNAISADQSIAIKAALFDGGQKLGKVHTRFFKVCNSTCKEIRLANAPHVEYSTGGAASLVDGFTGDLPWIPSEWLGFRGTDLDAAIDLGSEQQVNSVTLDVLTDEAGKIFPPREVEVKVSTDGINFTSAGKLDENRIAGLNRKFKIRFQPVKARWVKVVAKNSNGKDWLFADEISVE